MTRKKVKLAFIANDSSRKTTFKKRKKGLLKKVNELSTLCGITAGAIIYSPYDSNPEVWPSVAGMNKVIADFRALPEMDQHKKMVDQETFTQQRITKATEHMRKQKRDNREVEMTEVMYQCLLGKMGEFRLNILDLNDLGYVIDQFLKDVNRRIEILGGMEMGESSNAAAATAQDPSEPVGTLALLEGTIATVHGVGGSSSSAAVGASFFNQMYRDGLYDQSRNQMRFPFMDYAHHHQPQQHQLFPGECSSVPPTTTSSNATPTTTTTPNLTNNIRFH